MSKTSRISRPKYDTRIERFGRLLNGGRRLTRTISVARHRNSLLNAQDEFVSGRRGTYLKALDSLRPRDRQMAIAWFVSEMDSIGLVAYGSQVEEVLAASRGVQSNQNSQYYRLGKDHQQGPLLPCAWKQAKYDRKVDLAVFLWTDWHMYFNRLDSSTGQAQAPNFWDWLPPNGSSIRYIGLTVERIESKHGGILAPLFDHMLYEKLEQLCKRGFTRRMIQELYRQLVNRFGETVLAMYPTAKDFEREFRDAEFISDSGKFLFLQYFFPMMTSEYGLSLGIIREFVETGRIKPIQGEDSPTSEDRSEAIEDRGLVLQTFLEIFSGITIRDGVNSDERIVAFYLGNGDNFSFFFRRNVQTSEV